MVKYKKSPRIASWGKTVWADRIVHSLWVVARALFILGLSFVILYPLVYMISMAVRPIAQLQDPSVVWVPNGFHVGKYP